jgi:hypothetical protein
MPAALAQTQPGNLAGDSRRVKLADGSCAHGQQVVRSGRTGVPTMIGLYPRTAAKGLFFFQNDLERRSTYSRSKSSTPVGDQHDKTV